MAIKDHVLIVDSSTKWTGAYAGAVAISEFLKGHCDVSVLLKSNSELLTSADNFFYRCFSLPMLEIRKSFLSLFFYFPFLFFNAIRLRVIVEREGIGVVVMNDYYNLMGVMLKLMFWKGRVVTFVRYMPAGQNKILNFIWSNLAVHFSDVVVPVSNAVADQLPRSNRIKVVYNPSLVEGRAFKEKVRENKFVFLYVSNYIKGKGHDYAIKAFGKAFKDFSDVELHMCGSDMGLEKNIVWKRYLENLALENGVSKKVKFHDFDKNVLSRVERSDVVLNFSVSESFSQTCYEAISCGRPVISTDCGGPREIIEDGVSGYLVPVGDLPEMSKKMSELYLHQGRCLSMGVAGFNDSRRKFSKEKIREDLLDVIGLV